MATANLDVAVKVKGQTDLQKLERRMKALEDEVTRLTKQLPKAENGIRKTGRAAATASGNIQRLGVAFRTTLAPITAVVGSIALVGKALNTVGSRNAELATLRNGLRGLVDSSDAAAVALLNIADAAGKATLFDQEDFTATFKLFTSFRNIGVDAYKRVSMAAADMAQVIGSRPKEAALQLAKALEDPAKQVTALARSGTVFTEQQKAQIKVLQESGDLLGAQEIILSEIEKQYGGAAEAAGSSGFAGALDSLGESWRDFLEALGKASESSAIGLFNALNEGISFLTRNMDAITGVFSAAIDVLVKPFEALLEGIQSTLGPIGNFENQWRESIGIVIKVLTEFAKRLAPVFRVLGEWLGKAIRWFIDFATSVGRSMVGAAGSVAEGVRSMAQNISNLVNGTPVGMLIRLFGGNAGDWATSGLRVLADNVETNTARIKGYISELSAAGKDFAYGGGVLPDGSNPFAGAGPRNAAGVAGGSGGAGGKGSGGKKRTSKDDLAKIAQLAYGPQIIAAAKANNIDPRLLAGLVQVESGFRNNAVSSAGAAGLTQLMPGTAAELGVTDRFNPMQNLMGGAKYLRKMIDMFGDVTAGLRAYNQGPGNQQRYPGGVVQEAVLYPGKVLSAAAGFGFGAQGMADASVSGLEAMEKQREIAARILADAKERLAVAQANLDIEQALTPIQAAQLQTIENKRQIENEYQSMLKKDLDDQTKTTLRQAKDIELQLEEVKLQKQLKELREGAVQSITDEIAHLEAKLVGKEKEYLLEKEIARLKQAGVPADQAAALVQRREELQQQLAMLEETKQAWQSLANTIESEIGSAMSNAIVGLIDGTQTAEEAFSQMFKNIGKAFIDMATQMIAKALVMKALGILSPGIAGTTGSTFGSFGTGHSMGYSNLFSFDGGGYTGNGPRSGGIDGKGGFPAILHPQETVVDHHGAMGRYSAGGAGGGAMRTIRFESTVINNVEYVTTEQAMAMSRAAADDGAKRGAIGGHARSMSTLKNSRSQRAKLGMR